MEKQENEFEKIPLRDINQIKRLSKYLVENYKLIGKFYDWSEYFYSLGIEDSMISSKQWLKMKKEYIKNEEKFLDITDKYHSDQLCYQIDDYYFDCLNEGDLGYNV